jgi:hypothetical protein
MDLCEDCVYSNGRSGCWARKDVAVYGTNRCDFREMK